MSSCARAVAYQDATLARTLLRIRPSLAQHLEIDGREVRLVGPVEFAACHDGVWRAAINSRRAQVRARESKRES
eukprot:813414-Lingulodinium_polyedra.AAC.1